MNNDDKMQDMIYKCDKIEELKTALKKTLYALDHVISNQAELRFMDNNGCYMLPDFVNKRLQEALEIYVQSLMDDLNKLVKE